MTCLVNFSFHPGRKMAEVRDRARLALKRVCSPRMLVRFSKGNQLNPPRATQAPMLKEPSGNPTETPYSGLDVTSVPDPRDSLGSSLAQDAGASPAAPVQSLAVGLSPSTPTGLTESPQRPLAPPSSPIQDKSVGDAANQPASNPPDAKGQTRHHNPPQLNPINPADALEEALREELKAVHELIKARKFRAAIQKLKPVLSAAQPSGPVTAKRTGFGHKMLLLSVCFVMRNLFDNAFRCLRLAQAWVTDPIERSLILYTSGLLYFEHGAYTRAREAFQECLRVPNPRIRRSELVFRTALASKHEQSFDAALSLLQQVQKTPPPPLTVEDVMFQEGHVHQLRGDLPRAEAVFRSILKRNPQHAMTLREMAWLRVAQHRGGEVMPKRAYFQAVQYCNQALAPHGQVSVDARTQYVLGRCHLARKRHQDALRCMKTALTRDPTNAVYWFYYGVACFENSLYLKALNAYLRAVHLNSEFSLAWIHIAKLYQLYNQTEDAILAYKQAERQEPHNMSVAREIGWLKKQQEIKDAQVLRSDVKQSVMRRSAPTHSSLQVRPPSAAVHYDSPLVDPSAPSSVLALPSQPTAPHQPTHADVFLSGPGGQPSLSALPGIPVTSSQAVAVSASDTKRRVPGGAEHSSPPPPKRRRTTVSGAAPSGGGQELGNVASLNAGGAYGSFMSPYGFPNLNPYPSQPPYFMMSAQNQPTLGFAGGANVAKSTESSTQKQHKRQAPLSESVEHGAAKADSKV